ncbi:unnamed protein product [Choristocarpus tenellus]
MPKPLSLQGTQTDALRQPSTITLHRALPITSSCRVHNRPQQVLSHETKLLIKNRPDRTVSAAEYAILSVKVYYHRLPTPACSKLDL